MIKRIYYLIKPIIPRRFQLFLRRRLIKAKLSGYKNVWPILNGSEKQPENWKGWPDNKKFALIITHDVEHKRGYDKVLQLMEIEKELGFFSSFNFVPERDYKVEKNLLDTLKQNGFEYGVHGLYHDGKLFSSRQEFLRRAKKINQYLKDWGAVGFRAPSMHHNLDWIAALDIEYDLSTFDTDPFEPQADGVGTIFPFWVSNKRHKNGGYVELPYTLPQDSTLFILMREQSPEIWIKKTEWIAQHNGMVLINVHPDYIAFNETASLETFPVEIYQSFLKHISSTFANDYWNVLPKNLASFWRNNYKNSKVNLV